jgi:hypothetical protein
MSSQLAGPGDAMEDQTVDQFDSADRWRSATAHATGMKEAVDELTGEHLTKKSFEGSSGQSFVSHPQLNGVPGKKVQA